MATRCKKNAPALEDFPQPLRMAIARVMAGFDLDYPEALERAQNLNTDFRDKCQVCFPEFHPVNMVIDVDGLAPAISPQLLHILSPHPIPKKPRREPMSEAVRAEAVL